MTTQLTPENLFRDYGDWGKPIELFEAFLQRHMLDGVDGDGDVLEESGSTSDFATYMADKATKRLMWGYTDVSSSWRTYTRIFSVNDFKPISFTRLAEHPDLLQIPEGGEYKDSPLPEIAGPSFTVKKFGRLFSLTREALINDDLNQLRDRPAALGRAAARTISRSIAANLENATATAYDGNPVFTSGAPHFNQITDALSEQGLQNAITLLRVQTDPNGNRIGLRAGRLVVPAELEFIARRIINSTIVPMAGYGATQPAGPPNFGYGGTNVMQGITDYTVEEYLTDPNNWFLFADPNDAPVMAVGFLRGKENPDVMLRDPGMRLILGGSDPYTMEFDEIWWKVRHEWGTGYYDWRGAVKALVP